MAKYLVTGGAGFIGSNLVKRLCNDGHVVTVLDDFSTGHTLIDEANYLAGDIKDISLLDGDFDVCFHLAGKSRIQPSFESPLETFRVNAMGTACVIEYARKHKIKVVYAGSSSKHHNPKLSPYAESKWQGEEICKMYRGVYHIDVSITRFYNVYGPNEILEGEWAAVIGKWIGRLRKGESIQIVGDGNQRRDFTHVDDIVDGLLLASKNPPHEDAWELGYGENYSINEVADMFKNKFNNIRIESIPEQSGNYRITLRENNDALSMLGWTPLGNLREYIESLEI